MDIEDEGVDVGGVVTEAIVVVEVINLPHSGNTWEVMRTSNQCIHSYLLIIKDSSITSNTRRHNSNRAIISRAAVRIVASHQQDATRPTTAGLMMPAHIQELIVSNRLKAMCPMQLSRTDTTGATISVTDNFDRLVNQSMVIFFPRGFRIKCVILSIIHLLT